MFNISKLVNKITERGAGGREGEPARGSTSHVLQNTEEQHSEGFLCPQCMRAFPSSEVLEAHYNDVHVQNEHVSISGSEDAISSNNGGADEDVEILREQVQTLQLCLAEEKMTSEDLKNEVVKLQASYQMAGDSQGKQFEADRALLNSEVALLRKQLTDSLEQISTIKKDMEKVLVKNEALQTETQALKSTIGSLETQLTHKNSIDDAAVLKQELVSVQRMMDTLSLEKERQIEELNNKIKILEKSDASKELQLELSRAEENVKSLTNTVENQKLEVEQLVKEHQIEMKKSSEKLSEVNSELSEVNHRKADLDNQCATLTDELKRLNDQHAELYRKFEGGEGASAALTALQQENEQLKDHSTSLNQKISQLGKTMESDKHNFKSTINGLNSELSTMTENNKALNLKNQELTKGIADLNKRHETEKEELNQKISQLGKTMESDKLTFKSTIDGLNSELSAMTEKGKALNLKNQELTEGIADLNKRYETEKEELNGKINNLSGERKELEVRLAKTDHLVKEREESISQLKIECDRLSNGLSEEIAQKETELRDTQEKYENQITAEQLKYQSLMDMKQNQDKQIEELASEKVILLNKIEEESKVVVGLKSSETNLMNALEQKSNDCTEMSKKLENAQQSHQVLEENLRNAEIRTTEIQATYKAQIAELDKQLKLDQETSRNKIEELENIISNGEKETNQARESLQKMAQERKEATDRMGTMESQTEIINSKLKEMESEQKLLQDQRDSALKDKIELEKRLRGNEEEKSLLLEKCLSSETEFEQFQQKINGMQRKLDDSYAALQELGRENQSLQMESAKLQGRKWADDSVVTNCSTCGNNFSLTIRKHHCRHCGEIFCASCSSRTAAVPSCKKPARVCDNCYQELLTK